MIAAAVNNRILSDNNHKSIQYLLSWIRTQKDELMKNLYKKGGLPFGSILQMPAQANLKKIF